MFRHNLSEITLSNKRLMNLATLIETRLEMTDNLHYKTGVLQLR